jgi:hypothetical protein
MQYKQGKGVRQKEYFLDGRVATTKKGKKVQSGTQTPNSNSASYNHHKYEKEVVQGD